MGVIFFEETFFYTEVHRYSVTDDFSSMCISFVTKFD